jgi:hypothetical protein
VMQVCEGVAWEAECRGHEQKKVLGSSGASQPHAARAD